MIVDLIQDLHKVGVEGIDDDHYVPGSFRHTDDLHVVDADGSIVHTPPDAATLQGRLQEIVDWVNTDHDSNDDDLYLYPLIKAIILHFSIAYEHPFRDGNGRVARALFYWYLLKKDFSAFRYISISVLLKEAPSQYGKSYLYTESDQMDLTYFIEYQIDIILRAIRNFKEAYDDALLKREQFDRWLYQSGLYKRLNDKQRMILSVARSGFRAVFTIRDVERN